MSRARPVERASHANSHVNRLLEFKFRRGQSWFCAKPKISWLIKDRGMLPGYYTAHWNVFFYFKERMGILQD